MMNTNPLKTLETFGQSLWLDYIRRDLITSGQLRRLIEKDGLRGMTSNPSIFEKAIVDSHEYDEDIRAMALEGKGVNAIYDTLSQRDVQNAADEFRPVYDKTAGNDGYVSLEVNPHLAHDTNGTIEEAHRLWKTLARPNVFIKVPATSEGMSAIQALISEGINVNVTLLFGLPRYRHVAEAYLAARAARGKPLQHVASVAGFFVSRIDGLVDPLLEAVIAQGGKAADLAKKARGQVAIASTKMAYQIYKEMFWSGRFKELAVQEARVQRLLWASTSTKNPDESDVKYVEALIGPDTINTATLATLDAYRDHGDPKPRLEQDVEEARLMLERLPELGTTKLGRKLYEAPVGFKWFVEGLRDGSLGFAGEESAGASFARLDGSVWTTDKDGIVPALPAAEMTGRMGGDPGEIYRELAREFGEPIYDRVETPATPDQKKLLAKLSPQQVRLTELAGETIQTVFTHTPGNGAPIGGLKVVTESGWFAARPSGTEDIYKIYAESFRGDDHLHRILEEAQAIVNEALTTGTPHAHTSY